jgi:hypothetical protein
MIALSNSSVTEHLRCKDNNTETRGLLKDIKTYICLERNLKKYMNAYSKCSSQIVS